MQNYDLQPEAQKSVSWYSRSECYHLSPLLKWKLRNETAFLLNSAFLNSHSCPPPKKNIKILQTNCTSLQMYLGKSSVLQTEPRFSNWKCSSLHGNVLHQWSLVWFLKRSFHIITIDIPEFDSNFISFN